MGAPSPIEPELAIESVASDFPGLQILELLGRGGMGAVYKARQPALNRLVALKVFFPRDGKYSPEFAERFARETRALARLKHPNIVTLYDFGQSNSRYYLLMEYIDGINLRQAMRASRFSPEEALAMVPGICSALQYAHNEGIVHRDIKPENILIDTNGRAMIADFGLAKLMDPASHEFTLTGARDLVGTPHYMAPEQISNPRQVDHRVDIYALGVVLYEMLTGDLPVGRFAPPSEKAKVDERLDGVVFRALENEPARRYQTAREVSSDVENIRATARNHPDAPRSGCSLRTALIVLALLGVLCIAALIAWVAAGGAVQFTLRLGKNPPAAVTQMPRKPSPPVSPAVLCSDLEEQWRKIMDECTSGPAMLMQGPRRLEVLVKEGEWRHVQPPGELLLIYPRLNRAQEAAYARCLDEATSRNLLLRLSFDGRVTVLCTLPGSTRCYDVARDERSVVYDYNNGDATSQIATRPLPHGPQCIVTQPDTGGLQPSFSPDGIRIAYCAGRKLWLFNRGTLQRTVLVGDDSLKELPEWSPDGQWIVYQANAGDAYSYDVYRVRVSDGQTQRLTHDYGIDANPSFSPDGTGIVYASERATGNENPGFRGTGLYAYTMTSDGTSITKVLGSPRNIYFPRW